MSRTRRAARSLDRLDRAQRRHPVLGYPVAVLYKVLDDQGAYLAMALTHNAFVAVLPLLLICSSVLGFVLSGDPSLRTTLLDSALNEFPVIGTQLSSSAGLQGSVSAVVVGSLAALYGVIGLGQAFQNAVNVAWAVPRNSRRNPFASRAWSLLLVTGAGLLVLLLAALASLPVTLGALGPSWARDTQWASSVVSVAVTVVGLALLISASGPVRTRPRAALPGALVIAVGWHVLQRLGGLYVSHVIARASDVDAVFALSLGLLGFLYLAALVVVVGLEVDAVRARRLWPRALLTPFTDRVELTDADRAAYRSYATAQRHKGFESVTVTFDDQSGGRQGRGEQDGGVRPS